MVNLFELPAEMVFNINWLILSQCLIALISTEPWSKFKISEFGISGKKMDDILNDKQISEGK